MWVHYTMMILQTQGGKKRRNQNCTIIVLNVYFFLREGWDHTDKRVKRHDADSEPSGPVSYIVVNEWDPQTLHISFLCPGRKGKLCVLPDIVLHCCITLQGSRKSKINFLLQRANIFHSIPIIP